MEGYPEDKKLALEAELYDTYQKECAQDAKLVPASFYQAARQCGASVSNLGSLFFEEMSCCGYDPQRRQFACPVKISQIPVSVRRRCRAAASTCYIASQMRKACSVPSVMTACIWPMPGKRGSRAGSSQ